MIKCPDCNGLLEFLEETKTYTRYTCENQCNGENSHDAHYCNRCNFVMDGEYCTECFSECDECGDLTDKGQFCSPDCKKAYHDAYKHHGELASYYAYEESKYDDYYGGDY